MFVQPLQVSAVTIVDFDSRCLEYLRTYHRKVYVRLVSKHFPAMTGLNDIERRRGYLNSRPDLALTIFLRLHDAMNSVSPKGKFFGSNPIGSNEYGFWSVSEVSKGRTGENKEASSSLIQPASV